MKRSSFSCIQYVDHLVGVLVGALKDEGLYDDTTIIFWGDEEGEAGASSSALITMRLR